MSYKTILDGGQDEIEEKKSRFIAQVQPVSTEQEALDFLASVRKKYWDARHNCYAYVIGKNNEQTRCSDDGEPQGTAGRPILDVLTRAGVHDCIVVVTRYFGGTLLGTGGLVRAYQRATQAGLAASTVVEKCIGQRLTVLCDYNGIGKLQYITSRDRVPVLDTRYTDVVEMDVILPEGNLPPFCTQVTEATGGKAKFQTGDFAEFAQTEDGVILFDESE